MRPARASFLQEWHLAFVSAIILRTLHCCALIRTEPGGIYSNGLRPRTDKRINLGGNGVPKYRSCYGGYSCVIWFGMGAELLVSKARSY
jgi:hypothetical protein